jgi:hypothetical protein
MTSPITWIVAGVLFLSAYQCMSQSRYTMPTCASKSATDLGNTIKLRAPKGAIVRHGSDADYVEYSIARGKDSWLHGIWGVAATGGQVPDRLIKSSVEVTVRTWTFRDIQGPDAKGRLPNGNYWRFLAMFGEAVEYYDVPADAAIYFDRILDDACFIDRRSKQ